MRPHGIDAVMVKDIDGKYVEICTGNMGEILFFLTKRSGLNYDLDELRVHRQETLQHLTKDEYIKQARFEMIHEIIKDYVPADKSAHVSKRVSEMIEHYF